jgi:hypothetical protein
MAPFKSSLARSAGKLFSVYREDDLSLRGGVQSSRVPPPFSATGGSTYIPGNGFKYHVFKSPTSDNFISGGAGTVEVLVVGGGGGGGNGTYSGGGGGGGIIHDTAWSVVNATYPITIGTAGGAGTNGGDSYFGPPSAPQGLTGKGGGGGGHYVGGGPTDGSAGGSGGGDGSGGPGTAPAGNQPSVTRPNAPTQTNYGYPGGGPAAPGAVSSAGGGGAGAAGGANPGPSLGGQGGNGQPFSGFEYPLIGLSPLTPHSPTNNHYGGGGSGWGYSGDTNGTSGGYGGGGRGSSHPGATAPDKTGTPGVSHLGGGGAGNYSSPTGTPGGSGIIIIRYAYAV